MGCSAGPTPEVPAVTSMLTEAREVCWPHFRSLTVNVAKYPLGPLAEVYVCVAVGLVWVTGCEPSAEVNV